MDNGYYFISPPKGQRRIISKKKRIKKKHSRNMYERLYIVMWGDVHILRSMTNEIQTRTRHATR